MDFYKLTYDNRFSPARWEDDAVELESITCPINPEHQRAGGRLNNLTIILRSDSIGDFVWTWYGECIITEKVAELFSRAGLTGYDLLPVTVSRIEREGKEFGDLPKLWELRVLGWAGMAPPESGINLLKSCEGCGDLVYSAFDNPSALIKESQWDGSDIFMVWPLPVYIFVAGRVRDVVTANKLQGCKFIPIDKLPYGSDRNPLGTLEPGRLRWCMPEARARELGEPLGIY